MHKNSTALLVIIIFICSAQAEEDIFDLAEKYNKKKTQVIGIEEDRRRVLSDIYAIEKKTRKLVLQKNTLDEKKVQLKYDLSKISKNIVNIEEQISQLTPMLIERTQFLDKIQDLPWFYAFITSQSVTELDRLYQSTQHINGKQAEEVQQFMQLHTKMTDEKKKLNQTAKEIVLLQKEVKEQEVSIAKNQKNKKKYLKKVTSHLKNQKNRLKELKRLGKKTVAESDFKNLNLLFSTDFFDKKGQLPSPVQGVVIQEFGLIRSLSQDQVELMSKGVFFQSKAKQNVYTVASGRVRFSGLVKGYGKTLVIDHGGRYYSVYSNLKKSIIRKGQIVKAKQKIGYTGARHLIFNKGLYFEIRHFSEPQDPMKWLKKQDRNLATL